MPMKGIFEPEKCIIYAQQELVDCGIMDNAPFGIYHQDEVRPAVQTIMNVYARNLSGHIGLTRVFSVSEIERKVKSYELFSQFLDEAKRRGYTPPEFDAVLAPMLLYDDEKAKSPFNLDAALAEFCMKRFGP